MQPNIRRLLAIVLFLTAGVALAGVETDQGIVASVQLIDSSQLGGGNVLIVTFEDGDSYRFPGAKRLAAGAGVHLELRYLSAEEVDVPPQACRATVLAMPIERDGEEILQEAERPFEIYRNSASACRD